MTDLVLHQLAPSPNNVKVRIVLGLKELPCELVPVDPDDRSEVVRISGQPRTPVLVHEGRAVYDSHAIVRYLDANFPGGPRLFAEDYARQGDVERWELWVRGPHGLGEPVGALFAQAFAPERDADTIRAANATFAERLESVEEALSAAPHLLGEAITAADVTVAPFARLGLLTPSDDHHPLIAFFAENLRLPPQLERTREWVERIVAHDVAPVY